MRISSNTSIVREVPTAVTQFSNFPAWLKKRRCVGWNLRRSSSSCHPQRLDAVGGFSATNVLAKHDENYMPREVADTLKKQGVWRDDAKDKGAKP